MPNNNMNCDGKGKWSETEETDMNTTDPHAENKRLYALDEAAVGPEEAPKRWQMKFPDENENAWRRVFGPHWATGTQYRRDPNAPPLPSMEWHRAPMWAKYRKKTGNFISAVMTPDGGPIEHRPKPEWFALTATNKETDMSDDEILTGPALFRAIADAMESGDGPEMFSVLTPKQLMPEREPDSWLDLIAMDSESFVIRRKPSAHTVTLESGKRIEVPKPMTEVPSRGTHFWLLFPGDDTHPTIWVGEDMNHRWLAQNRCYATREARDQAERALTQILTGGAA